MSEPAIRVERLSKVFGGLRAVRTDQHATLAARDRKRYLVDGAQAAEHF